MIDGASTQIKTHGTDEKTIFEKRDEDHDKDKDNHKDKDKVWIFFRDNPKKGLPQWLGGGHRGQNNGSLSNLG